jgi:hypothetical protein
VKSTFFIKFMTHIAIAEFRINETQKGKFVVIATSRY